ncbi:MAG: hypothetical protein HZR80_05825 [Candidatus Heimdallarchaeota archaeon]
MNKDLTDIDPLIIFRCKNHQCRQIFSPSTMMNVAKQKVFFECPVCGSQYEAQYALVSGYSNNEVIILQERPRLVYVRTRIASS